MQRLHVKLASFEGYTFINCLLGNRLLVSCIFQNNSTDFQMKLTGLVTKVLKMGSLSLKWSCNPTGMDK